MSMTLYATLNDGRSYSAIGYKSKSTTKNCMETDGYPNGTCTEPWTSTYGTTVYKLDTRYYLYAGTVWTEDIRYNYWTQTYSGTIYRPDSRIYRYQGNVIKPDTRVYKYSQLYSGTLFIPEEAIYKYKGIVTKPTTDTRVIENYYKYNLNIKYKEK